MLLYDLLTGFRFSREGCIWCTDGSFMKPRKFRSLDKDAFGYVLTMNYAVSLKRSEEKLPWSKSERYCLDKVNAKLRGHLPGSFNLKVLYESIMWGKMKEDLIKAGLYESCNYRMPCGPATNGDPTRPDWSHVWTNEEGSDDFTAYYVSSTGYLYSKPKDYMSFTIPFYKIRKYDDVIQFNLRK